MCQQHAICVPSPIGSFQDHRPFDSPYSPKLNPEEQLNADLKLSIGKRVPVRTKAKLRDAANAHVAMLEKSPERVMSCFHDPGVKYAAG